jgi:8-oxo-dGTP pyrophosphatase MutT (NUDIX family)
MPDEPAARPSRRRDASRVLLLDPFDRLLLIKIHDPAHLVSVPGRATPDSYWITVGGGLEGDETFEAAATREIFEEVGITDAQLGPVLWDRTFAVLLDGVPIHGVERYHVAWTSTVDVSFGNVTAEERTQFVEHRWWSYDELADERRTDTAFPEELVGLLQQALVLGRPTEG